MDFADVRYWHLADISLCAGHVCFSPKADIGSSLNASRLTPPGPCEGRILGPESVRTGWARRDRLLGMTGYGQFCSMARAHEVLGGRWTLLIVREILSGSRRFNDIRRGIPRVSRTVLSERLQALVIVGAIARTDGPHGPEYELTKSGQELMALVSALGTWGQRWLAREPANEDLDLEPLLVDMQRRVRFTALPKEPFVVRFEVRGHHRRFMLLKKTEASLCHRNPGFPEPVCVRGPLAALIAWWRGDVSFLEAQRMGLVIDGPKTFTRAFPKWFNLYPFAHIRPVGRKTEKSPSAALIAVGAS
jgi:DNA-binding HxlR family transcriptional regulator